MISKHFVVFALKVVFFQVMEKEEAARAYNEAQEQNKTAGQVLDSNNLIH